MGEKETNKSIINHFEKDANCQVFNGPISGCVFAMPGSNVTQQTAQRNENTHEADENIVTKLRPMFFGNDEDTRVFLKSIMGAEPTQITDLVRKMVAEKKLSDISCHRPLWQVLHEYGIYDKTERNWNSQIY